MALTETQKAEVRRFLGYSDLSRGGVSILEAVLIALSPEAEVQVVAVLADLTAIEVRLRASWPLQVAKRAEEVELWGWEGIMALRMEGNRLAAMLGSILCVPVLVPPFTAGGGAVGSTIRG